MLALAFNQDIMPDDSLVRLAVQARRRGIGLLPFDLEVVTDGIDDDIIFDDTIDDRKSAIRIIEIHPGAGTDDLILTYGPIPGRTFGRNGDIFSMIILSYKGIFFDQNIMRISPRIYPLMKSTLSLSTVKFFIAR